MEIEKIIGRILAADEVRADLASLRAAFAKEPASVEELVTAQLIERLYELLAHEDAKTRKNAALFLGDLGARYFRAIYAETLIAQATDSANIAYDVQDIIAKLQETPAYLWNAYKKEETRFVLESYIKALASFDCGELYADLIAERDRLAKVVPAEDEKKHLYALRHALDELLSSYDKSASAALVFRGMHKCHLLFFPIEGNMRPLLLDALKKTGAQSVKETSDGVTAIADSLSQIGQIRIFPELQFVIRMKKDAKTDREHLIASLVDSELLPLLRECYGKAEGISFSLRDTSETLSPEQLLRMAYELEEASSGALLNHRDPHGITFFLTKRGENSYRVTAVLPGSVPERFSYRKNVLPTSMQPVAAAQMVALIRPYLREGAHCIDPFCGVGSLLIERNHILAMRDVYGVDTYGEAIAYARENTKAAGWEFYYINRNYFDFTSEYLLDEVICEFPHMQKQDLAEVDAFYRQFFEKTSEITTEGAMLFLLSAEEQTIKRQLRLHPEYSLTRQIPFRRAQIFIITKRG